MRQSVRKSCVWAFTACFAGISLLGSGWHCVFGHHFHGASAVCGPAACSDHHTHAHQPVDRTTKNRPANINALAIGPNSGGPNSGSENFAARQVDDEHDCPLCQFFGSAQWAQVFAPVELVLAAGEPLVAAELSLCLTHVGSYRSRAPPVGAPLS